MLNLLMLGIVKYLKLSVNQDKTGMSILRMAVCVFLDCRSRQNRKYLEVYCESSYFWGFCKRLNEVRYGICVLCSENVQSSVWLGVFTY